MWSESKSKTWQDPAARRKSESGGPETMTQCVLLGGFNSIAHGHNHETLRLRIRRHHFRTINPLLERSALLEISQLPLPNLAH
jgi:hypothetical protein